MSTRTPRTEPSAPNVIFLIGFGMFLTLAVLPVLISALIRTFVFLALLIIVAAASNPSDHSFACWISGQDNVRMKEKPNVKQWISAVFKTAIALVSNEKMSWTYYNIIIFSVAYVPSLERYAFGCFGAWWWADTNPKLFELCRAPWIKKFTKGGIESSIEKYAGLTGRDRRTSLNTSTLAGVRRRHIGEMEDAATTFRGVLGDLAATFQPSATCSSPDLGITDRQIRAKAIQAKINKDWRVAAQYFMEASTIATSLISRTSYRQEAAWCNLEELQKFPTSTDEVVQLIEGVCEELVSSGYFEDAARALSQLALRLKRKFLLDRTSSESVAVLIANLYCRAKTIAEAGNSTHIAIDNALRAAAIYSDATLWQLAEECYDMAGHMQLNAGQGMFASGSFGDAVLCRIGRLDVTGANQQADIYVKLLREHGGSVDSVLDNLLQNVFSAYDKWSIMNLQSAIKRYESKSPLRPWQRQCLRNLEEKMNQGDLR